MSKNVEYAFGWFALTGICAVVMLIVFLLFSGGVMVDIRALYVNVSTLIVLTGMCLGIASYLSGDE
jgi:hypothetical protein